MVPLDATDRELLDLLQGAVPLCADPFGELGGRIGIGADDVLARIRRLKKRQIVRQISAIFDSRALGYASSLVAARVEPGRIESAARVVGGHPGVSHSYQRNHAFNLWFTLAVPPTSRLGLDGTVELLARQSGAERMLSLPAERVFKIGVNLPMGEAGVSGQGSGDRGKEGDAAGMRRHDDPGKPGEKFPSPLGRGGRGEGQPDKCPSSGLPFRETQEAGISGQWSGDRGKRGDDAVTQGRGNTASPSASGLPFRETPETRVRPLDQTDVELVRILQDDLPLEREPFADWTRRAGMPLDDFLASAREMHARRIMRRFAAVLHHRIAGFSANAMVVWDVSADRIELAGRIMAGFAEVSHCYQRPTYPPDWPFSLYTMIHGRSYEECESVSAEIAQAIGPPAPPHEALYSVREFRKQRVRYFTGEIEAWEERQGPAVSD